MAERRMFAKSIVLSDVFLDMPMSARCLYFTLSMFADDDGFVGSPKAIMRQCGASQDDMLVLLNKRFILGFESGVIVIKHWRINNYLKNDRHKPTTYIEEYETLMLDAKKAYKEKQVSKLYPNGIQNVSTLDTQYSIGKDSIDKDSIEERECSSADTASVQEMFNSICVSYPQVTVMSDKRKKSSRNLAKRYGIDKIKQCFEIAEKSAFLSGKNSKGWKANFDWLINETNFCKVLDGNYTDAEQSTAISDFEKMAFAELGKEYNNERNII